jgi:hypothetical protein
MSRNTLMLILAGGVVALSALMLASHLSLPGPEIASDEGRAVIEAPGRRVDRRGDSTRIQAPGVDITIPKDKDAD